VVNRLTPSEFRAVMKAVDSWNDSAARAGERVVDRAKLRRILRG
jgi:hypothetical protein